MKPIEFKEQNVVIAKDQPEYLPLPAYKEKKSDKGEVIACWKLSWRERFKVLWTGKMWWCALTFHQPLQPQRPSVDKWELLNKEYFHPSQGERASTIDVSPKEID